MPAVLTTASTVLCPHGAPVVFSASQQLLTAGGSPVLLQSDVSAATVSACPNTGAPGLKPCTKLVSLVAGAATKLSVAGQAVLLETARGLTDAAPPLPVFWQVSAAGQTVLEAV